MNKFFLNRAAAIFMAVFIMLTQLPSVAAGALSGEESIGIRGDDYEFEDGDRTADSNNNVLSEEHVQSVIAESIQTNAHDNLRDKKPYGDNLSATQQIVFEKLKTCFAEVAAGERTYTVFEITPQELGIQTSWTAQELLGKSSIDNQKESDQACEAAYKMIHEAIGISDMKKIVNMLLANAPYESYWFDKSKGWQTEMPGLTISSSGLRIAQGEVFRFKFAVCRDYAGEEEYSTDNSRINAAKSVVSTAMKIVDDYSSVSDYDKLRGYLQEICKLASYNDSVDQNPNTPYGNPWQLIYVFDNDDSTSVVCEGYAKAFQYLCDLTDFSSNITCYTVTGFVTAKTGSGSHMWNIVTMEDNRNYYIDVTNCDQGSIGYPDQIFLPAADKVAVGKAYVVTCNGNEWLRYDYNSDMSDMYSLDDLTISEKAYVHRLDPHYTVPTGLTAVYGQTLSDVGLPEGWSWQDDLTTPVGNVGINRFKATFTPADTDHYNSVKDIEIDINVTKINESSVESVNGGDPSGINQTVRNKLFDVKIKLPFPVERFIVFNENGKGIPNSIVSSENCEDGRILYAIRLSIGTKGKRTLALYAKVDGKTVSLGLSFDITVNEIKADQTVQKRLLDVQVDVTPCKRNVPFIVTVKTTSAVQRVGIFNQNGAGVSKKLISATTENNVTTTVYSVSVGSKGTRVFFVRMAQDDGTWSDDSISFTKTIEK